MKISGNVQAFVLAILIDVGFFAYILLTTASQQPLDLAIWTALVGFVGVGNTYFFSSHIANGAAAKAIDVLVAANGKDKALKPANNEPQKPV